MMSSIALSRSWRLVLICVRRCEQMQHVRKQFIVLFFPKTTVLHTLSFFSISINIILCILLSLLLIFTLSTLFFLTVIPLGLFFSSAEVLFVLYPLQSSEYFYMNISLTSTHSPSIFSHALPH